MKAFHACNMRAEIGDGLPGFCASGQGYAQVAREQNLADRVIEVEVALGMQEMRGQQHQFAMAQRQASARIGHPDDAIFRLAHLGEVRCKALPDARDDQLRARAAHPAVQRGNDVRVGMRGNQIGELLRRKMPRHAHEQLVESQIAAGIDDGSRAVVHNQELIGLNGLAVLLDEVGEHQADVVFVAIELNGHDGLSKDKMPSL